MKTRRAAAQTISLIIDDGQSLTIALETTLKAVSSHQDKAFVQALCYGVCRHYHQLDFILNQLVNKPIKDTEIKVLALVGLYQLRFTRVKPYAAISETVAATGKKSWAKALLNAVLRNYVRRQDELNAALAHNSVATSSHPEWLVQQISASWPEQAHTILTTNNQQAAMTLRVNRLKTSRQDYLNTLGQHNIAADIGQHSPSAIILNQAMGVDALPGFADGLVSVQDEAAQLAAELLDGQAGDRILDVCAAPGGKTAHLLENQPQLKELVAIDIDSSRLQRIHDNLQRLELTANLHCLDATEIATWWDGIPFQRILLDAPCSALGVIRRHPDIKLLRRADDIQTLVRIQKKLLDSIWPLLAPGGVLLYATCSILKQENEQQSSAFLKNHHNAVEWPIEASWGISQQIGRQILPGDFGMDGFYYARFKKI